MKIRKSFWIVIAVLLFVLALLPVSAGAERGATVVEFAGSEELLELVYDGDLSGRGDNFHGRNREWLAYETTDNSCMSGISHLFSNANMNKNGHENYWGKWIIEPEGYAGTWEAVWHVQGSNAMVAFGHGTGVFTGMTAKWVFPDSDSLAYTGTINIPPNAQVSCSE